MSRVEQGPLKRIGRIVTAIATVGAGAFGPTPPDAGQALNQALHNLNGKNPDNSAKAGEYSTSRIIRRVDAQGNITFAYRALLPIAPSSADVSTGQVAGTPIPIPDRTPTPTPTRTPTETPTPEPTVIPCSPWPEGDYDVLALLPVVEGLCLTIFEDPSQAPDWIRQYGAGYDPSIRRVLYLRSRIPNDPQFTTVHELCHAHQHKSVLDAGLGEPPGNLRTWLSTPEGIAFVDASNATIRSNSFPWSNFGDNPVEDFAEICRHTYKPAKEGHGWLNGWPILVDFVRKWLPTGTYR